MFTEIITKIEQGRERRFIQRAKARDKARANLALQLEAEKQWAAERRANALNASAATAFSHKYTSTRCRRCTLVLLRVRPFVATCCGPRHHIRVYRRSDEHYGPNRRPDSLWYAVQARTPPFV